MRGDVAEDVADAQHGYGRHTLQERHMPEAADGHLVQRDGNVIGVAQVDRVGGYDLRARDGGGVLVGAGKLVQQIPRRDDPAELA